MKFLLILYVFVRGDVVTDETNTDPKRYNEDVSKSNEFQCWWVDEEIKPSHIKEY
jgi:hypothetical protein